MLKGKSVIGKEILSLAEGVKLEKVNDVVVDPEGRRMVALVVSEGGFMSGSRVIPMGAVSSFGKDAVVIASSSSIIPASSDPELRDLVEREDKILGKTVYTTTGDEQGSIADIYFEESTGQVVGYEISGGMLGDAAKGRSYLATEEITAIGDDVIYVEPETASALESQVGGIQAAVKGAGDKLGEAKDAATLKAGEARDGARKRASEATPEQALVGRRTGSDVETDSGSVLVPKGRRVREEDVRAAKDAGRLQALTAAVALGDAQEAGADAKDALGAAGDKAGSLWDQFTAKISEMTDSTGRRVDAAQTKQRLDDIADAIGRPVSKVILDRQDNVVLNMGDIITHQGIQRAHESGGLESLLSSVYRGEVQFTKDEMRAPGDVEAEATVDKSSGGAVIVDELESKVQAAEREKEAEKERKRAQSDADRTKREKERETRATDRDSGAFDRTRSSNLDIESGADADAADDTEDETTMAAVGPGRATVSSSGGGGRSQRNR
ncbi:MAG TPA: PRC-barrel domain-containing protein [Candidatus Limnocylindrales bacterium]|nr:PRC-barrel domain-containing protein [Candidatus Limnocylindrales bacterium]